MEKIKFKILCTNGPSSAYAEEAEGVLFEYEGEQFVFTKDKKAQLEFYHLKSGLGFNGNNSGNYRNYIDSFEFRVNEIGKEEFIETIKSQIPIDEKLNQINNKSRFKHIKGKDGQKFIPQIYANRFSHTFATNPKKYQDGILSMTMGRYVLDIVKFDDMLHEKFGYNEEEHGSMNDFITKKWSKEVLTMVHDLSGI